MSSNDSRMKLIKCFINLDGDIFDISKKLRSFEWDYTGDPFTLSSEALQKVLHEHIEGKLSSEDAEFWANFIEVRDDVDISPALKDYVYWLANPDLGYALTSHSAQKWLHELKAMQR